jgi:hypothetical protein
LYIVSDPDPDSGRSADADPDWESGSGSRQVVWRVWRRLRRHIWRFLIKKFLIDHFFTTKDKTANFVKVHAPLHIQFAWKGLFHRHSKQYLLRYVPA